MDDNIKGKEEEGTMPDELAQVKAQCEEYLSGWQRAKADFANYKKDEARRAEEVAKYANEDIIRELVGVLDNFDLGLAALERNGPVDKGIYMIRAGLEDMLRRRGLERVTIRAGDPFDPAVAEAIAAVESDLPEGTVAEEIEAAYRLHGKLIRPARVKIAKIGDKGTVTGDREQE